MSRHQPRRAHFGDDYTLRPNIIRRRVNCLVAVYGITEPRAIDIVVYTRLVLERHRLSGALILLYTGSLDRRMARMRARMTDVGVAAQLIAAQIHASATMWATANEEA